MAAPRVCAHQTTRPSVRCHDNFRRCIGYGLSTLTQEKGVKSSLIRRNKADDRHITTRYEKHAAYFLAFFKLAAIHLWLRVLESTV